MPLFSSLLVKFALVAGLLVLASGACRSGPEKAVPIASAPPPATVDELGLHAEQFVNQADAALRAFEPQRAEQALEQAETIFEDPRFKEYPEDDVIRDRHRELRKVLPRVQEVVRRRKLQAELEQAQEKIEWAQGELQESMGALKEKDPSDEEFRRARKALTTLEHVIDEHAQLESKVPQYGSYARAMRRQTEKDGVWIRKERLQVLVKRRKNEIELSFSMLDETARALKQKNTDQHQFEQAASKLRATSKTIEKGRDLESRDPAYKKAAMLYRKRLRKTKNAIASRHQTYRLQTARHEIDALRAELRSALKQNAVQDPTPEELDEAQKTGDTLEKTLSRVKRLGTESKRFAQYLLACRSELLRARHQIRKQRVELVILEKQQEIEAALERVNEKKARIREPGPQPADFQELKTAVRSTEVLIRKSSQLRKKSSTFEAFLSKAQKTLKNTRSEIKSRQANLLADAQTQKLNDEVQQMEDALARVKEKDAEKRDFDRAHQQIKQVRAALLNGHEMEAKSKTYRAQARKVRQWLQKVKKRIRARHQNLRIVLKKEEIKDLLGQLESAQKQSLSGKATTQEVAAAMNLAKELRRALRTGRELEIKDRRYRSLAAKTRARQKKIAEGLKDAQALANFRETPLQAAEEGMNLIRKAKTVENLSQKHQLLAQALDKIRMCQKSAAKFIARRPKIARQKLHLGERQVRAKDILTACRKRVRTLNKKNLKIKNSLTFYKNSIEPFRKGRDLLERGENLGAPHRRRAALSEALAQFRSCANYGARFVQKHPDLKNTRVPIDGQQKSFKKIVSLCRKSAKTTKKKMAGI